MEEDEMVEDQEVERNRKDEKIPVICWSWQEKQAPENYRCLWKDCERRKFQNSGRIVLSDHCFNEKKVDCFVMDKEAWDCKKRWLTVWEKLLYEQLKRIKIEDWWFNFMAAKSTTDAIFISRQLQENYKGDKQGAVSCVCRSGNALDRFLRRATTVLGYYNRRCQRGL